MTNKTQVTEATIVGENCGACIQFHAYYDKKIQTRIECLLVWPPTVEWNYRGKPLKGTDHPPGRSVCPEFEAME